MKTGKTWRDPAHAVIMAAALVLGAGLAHAKLPAPDDAAKVKAEEAKAKAADATKKAREAEEKAMDRVAERYKKERGMKTVATTTPVAKKK